MDSDVPFDLTCWYLNSRRVLELVGSDELYAQLGRLEQLSDYMRVNAELQIQKKAVFDWLRSANPPTLGKLIVEDKVVEGQLFTHYSNFFFRGLSKVSADLNKGKTPLLAEGYTKIDLWKPEAKLCFEYHHEHLTSNSAWVELAGQKRMFLLGLIKRIDGNQIVVAPYVIANPVPDLFSGETRGQRWSQHLEVHIDSIDSFSRVRDNRARPVKKHLEYLKNVPENDVKTAIAEIIGEPTIPKDWGGERSDLFTSRVELSGERISAAFALKGPAQFKPMTLAQLGKNGDQIDRLYSEPADLFVLQHCHEITPPVRGAKRTLASGELPSGGFGRKRRAVRLSE